MNLTILGSGKSIHPKNGVYRYPPAYLVEFDQTKILLDCSYVALPQLATLNIHPYEIDAIYISHYHADHFTVQPFLQTLLAYAGQDSTKPRLKIYGPSDIEKKVIDGYILYGHNETDSLFDALDLSLEPYVKERNSSVSPDYQSYSFQTFHSGLEAYCLRLSANSKVISYSGDSGETGAIKLASRGADLFLCEASYDKNGPRNENHLSAQQAGKISQSSIVKHLVVTHYTGNDSSEVMKNEILKSGFKSKISIAKDLSSYKI